MDNSAVLVQLSSGGLGYTYFNHDPDVCEGDFVVVELPHMRSRSHDYAVGRVVSVTPSLQELAKASKWIVCKVRMDAYIALKQMIPTRKDQKV